MLAKQQQLNVLKKLGFKTADYQVMSVSCIDGPSLTSLIKQRKQQSLYEIDGIVIDVDDPQQRLDLNPTRDTLNPAYSVKYKITDDSMAITANVVDIDINVSKDGYLKPRIEIEPVDLLGVTITWATGFNMGFIYENQIGPGSTVQLVRSGDVIPYIQKTLTPSTVEDYDQWFNDKVDTFGSSHWTDTNIDLVLNNIDDNSTVKFERLNAFFDSLECPFLGEGNLQRLFDLGLEQPEFIIELTQEDLSTALKSKVLGKKIHQGIREKLTNIPLYKLMGATHLFGRGIGQRKMKKLWEAFEGDMSRCTNIDNILCVEGFDSKTATKIVSGYPDFVEFLNYIEPYIKIQEFVKPAEGILSDKIIVFTGVRDKSMEKKIESIGGKIGTSVSNKTSYVVTNNPAGSSSKLDKARILNIPILTLSQMAEML